MGSGHGFKNGPAMGEYVASVVALGAPLAERPLHFDVILQSWDTANKPTELRLQRLHDVGQAETKPLPS